MYKKVALIIIPMLLIGSGVLNGLTSGESNSGVPIYIPGLVDHDVTVYRDNWGVPHIYAQSLSDAYFAWGYVMAQDRLFEMDLFRRTVAGRLTEIFGSSQFSQDVLMRTLGVYQIAVDTWNGLYPDSVVPTDIKADLEQFSNGVNEYIRDLSIPSGVPIEYVALSAVTGVPLTYFIPYPWTPPDSLAIAGMMGLMLTDTSEQEIIRGAFSVMVDPIFQTQGLSGMSDFLMPTGWQNMTTISMPDPPLESLGQIKSEIEAITTPVQKALGFTGGLSGSNDWVISGKNTTTGNAMLANDPHLALQAPGINWQVHIDVPGWANVIGCCIPGGSVIYTGHNDYIAFGVTNLMADVMDLYYYVSNATHYYYMDHWEPFNVTMVTIYNFTQPIKIPVVSTRHGPLITTPLPPPFDKMAVKWAGKLSGYGEVTGFSLLDKATSIPEWKQALSHMCVIIQNYVCADEAGNIAWCPSGKIPLRPPPAPAGTGTLGVVPSNGSAGQNEWFGWIPHSSSPATLPPPYNAVYPSPVSLPYIENPPQGFIATANNQPIGPGYPGYPWPVWIGPAFEFDPGYRAQRITELIKSLSPISIDDMKTIQADTVCIPARSMVPIILGAMGFPSSTGNATIDQALGILATWNLTESKDLVAPLIWEAFLEKYANNTFYDEFGPSGLYPFPNAIIPLMNMTLDLALGKMNLYAITLFDNKFTPSQGPGKPGWENMPQIMNKSLHDAVDWIASQLGRPIDAAFSNWKYGNLHVVYFGHAMGSMGLSFMNVPTVPVGCNGGPFTVNPGSHYHNLIVKDFMFVGTGSSYRGIYECKDGWNTSLILVPPGESGLVTTYQFPFPSFNPHYADTFSKWLNVEYTPCLYDDAVIQTFQQTVIYQVSHNILVASVTTSPTGVPVGTITQIGVTVKNEAATNETFQTTLSYDNNVIGTQTVTNLASGATQLLTFNWDTTGVSQGDHTLTANASAVPGETHLIDNVKTINVRVGTTTIRVEPATTTYSPQMLNETFVVNVTINDLGQFWRATGFQFRLCYDSNVLQLVNVTEGPFMQDPSWNHHGTFFIKINETDPTYGPSVVIGDTLLPDSSGTWDAFPSGSGTVATFTFKPQPGVPGTSMSSLHLVESRIVDDNLNQVPSSTQDGLFRVSLNICDLNLDGKVDIQDIVLAAKAFGTKPGHPRWNPIADVAGSTLGVPDGRVDIIDIAYIARNFGWTAPGS